MCLAIPYPRASLDAALCETGLTPASPLFCNFMSDPNRISLPGPDFSRTAGLRRETDVKALSSCRSACRRVPAHWACPGFTLCVVNGVFTVVSFAGWAGQRTLHCPFVFCVTHLIARLCIIVQRPFRNLLACVGLSPEILLHG